MLTQKATLAQPCSIWPVKQGLLSHHRSKICQHRFARLQHLQPHYTIDDGLIPTDLPTRR